MLKDKSKIKYILILIVFIGIVFLIQNLGLDEIRSKISVSGPLAPIGLFTMRFASVVIPALPSTMYSLLSGALLGFKKGLLVVIKNQKLVGLVDPGIFYGHNEMELAYLRWFKIVDKKFIQKYDSYSKLNKNYYDYEPIYQLYYSLSNIYLWSRNYINDTAKLLKKIKI